MTEYSVAFVGTGPDPDTPVWGESAAMAYRHGAGYRKLDNCDLVACADLVHENAEDFAAEFDIDSPSPGTGDEDDVSPARKRAKATGDAPESDADAEDGARETPPRRRPDRDEEGVETPGQDFDLGALVGLGVLTLVAALVRKYDEERTRPHDPLVDGPLDEDDDVADDDQ